MATVEPFKLSAEDRDKLADILASHAQTWNDSLLSHRETVTNSYLDQIEEFLGERLEDVVDDGAEVR